MAPPPNVRRDGAAAAMLREQQRQQQRQHFRQPQQQQQQQHHRHQQGPPPPTPPRQAQAHAQVQRRPVQGRGGERRRAQSPSTSTSTRREVLYHPPPASYALCAALLLLESPPPGHRGGGAPEDDDGARGGDDGGARTATGGAAGAASAATNPPFSYANAASAAAGSAAGAGAGGTKPLSILSSSDSVELSYHSPIRPGQAAALVAAGGRQASARGGGGGEGDDHGTEEEEGEDEETYVYLLPRPWLQNWIRWAAHQSAPPGERSRVRAALRAVAAMYDLTPPRCGCPELPPNGDCQDGRGGSCGGCSPTAEADDEVPPGAAAAAEAEASRMVVLAVVERKRSLDPIEMQRSLSSGAASTLHLSRGGSGSFGAGPPSVTPSRSGDSSAASSAASVGGDGGGRSGGDPVAAERYRDPGPVDATPLSLPGHPLLLRPNVVIGRGTAPPSPPVQQRRRKVAAAESAGRRSSVNSDTACDGKSESGGGAVPASRGGRRGRSAAVGGDGGSRGRRSHSLSGPIARREEAAVPSSSSASSSAASAAAARGGTAVAAGPSSALPLLWPAAPSSTDDKVGACPVSERFYECVRSVHGVLCADGASVSFQRPRPAGCGTNGAGGGSGGAVLHHHVMSKSSGSASTSPPSSLPAAAAGRPSRQANGSLLLPPMSPTRRQQQQQQHNSKSGGSPPGKMNHVLANGNGNLPFRHNGGEATSRSPRRHPSSNAAGVPIEFRRRVIYPKRAVASFCGVGSSAEREEDSSGVNASVRAAAEVEVHPVQFFYRMIDPLSPHTSSSSFAGGVPLGSVGDDGGRGTVAENGSGPASQGNGHHHHPQQHLHRDEKGAGTGTGGGSSRQHQNHQRHHHQHDGFALLSRSSPMRDALASLLRTVAPSKSSACVRAWIRYELPSDDGSGGVASSSAGGGGGGGGCRRRSSTGRDGRHLGGTAHGDGYELWTDLCPAGERDIAVRGDINEAGHPPLVTVGEWMMSRSAGGERGRLDVLVETRWNANGPWVREQCALGHRVQVGDFIDAQDSTGKWYEAVVREVNDDSMKVHYAGWSSRWDSIVPRFVAQGQNGQKKLPGPAAPLWSQTDRWRNDIRVGQEVEVREASSLVQRPKWFRAMIRAVGREADPMRLIVGGADLEAYEIVEDQENSERSKNGEDAGVAASSGAKRTGTKKLPLLLLNRKRQVLVEVPQEKFNSTLPNSVVATSKGSTDASTCNPPSPSPPFIRWVNLYGEEICSVYTHNQSRKGADDGTPATIKYAHDPNRAPVEVLRSHNNIHGAGFVRESMKGIPPAPGSVGLHNLGNSCFLNSILQCLNHIEPMTQFFLKGDYRADVNKTNPLGSGGRVAVAYAALLNDMWSGEYSTLAPRLLKATVAQFAPQFNNCYQHDSQEFCSFLMDGLHEDLNRVKEKPYVEEFEGLGIADARVAKETWTKHLLRHDSVIVDHCQGMHRSHLTCPDCNHKSLKFDVYSTISLPLPPMHENQTSIPLSACLAAFTSEEQLDKHNAWYCPECKRHVLAKKKISLWSTPDILILHLKRFMFDKCNKFEGRILRSKVEDTVNFPVDGLDMSPYMLGPQDDDAPPTYKLFGVSEHSGATANSGHYTATVRNSLDGKWYRYNDSHVGITSGEVSITGGAYVLFYQRSKGKARWAGMERQLSGYGVDQHGSVEMDFDGFQEVKTKTKKKKRT